MYRVWAASYMKPKMDDDYAYTAMGSNGVVAAIADGVSTSPVRGAVAARYAVASYLAMNTTAGEPPRLPGPRCSGRYVIPGLREAVESLVSEILREKQEAGGDIVSGQYVELDRLLYLGDAIPPLLCGAGLDSYSTLIGVVARGDTVYIDYVGDGDVLYWRLALRGGKVSASDSSVKWLGSARLGEKLTSYVSAARGVVGTALRLSLTARPRDVVVAATDGAAVLENLDKVYAALVESAETGWSTDPATGILRRILGERTPGDDATVLVVARVDA